jgi:hypothetical protein
MKVEGFKGCMDFVDGMSFPVFQWPGCDGKVFFDQKKQYSINTQIICDCDKYITCFMTAWPGSCADSFTFKKMGLSLDPESFFDPGKYT